MAVGEEIPLGYDSESRHCGGFSSADVGGNAMNL